MVNKVKIHPHFVLSVHQTPHYKYWYKPSVPHCICNKLQTNKQTFNQCHLEVTVLMYLRKSKYRSLFARHINFLLFSEHSTVSKNQMEFKDLFLQRNSGHRRNENIIPPQPETNFIRNSIRFRVAITWNT